MAEVELVIRIPEEIRLALINNIPLSLDQQSICDSCIKQAIINGTPLPKGHGRLVDADALIDSLDVSDRDIYCKAVIEEDAQTIIEADKSEREDKE